MKECSHDEIQEENLPLNLESHRDLERFKNRRLKMLQIRKEKGTKILKKTKTFSRFFFFYLRLAQADSIRAPPPRFNSARAVTDTSGTANVRSSLSLYLQAYVLNMPLSAQLSLLIGRNVHPLDSSFYPRLHTTGLTLENCDCHNHSFPPCK